MNSPADTLFTIGHSRHPIEHFVALLRQHAIELVADVRSTPFSRFNPQFNRGRLEESLRVADIRYEFLGEELGARSKDPACYEGDRVSYAKLAASAEFKRGLAWLLTQMRTQRVAIMCAEREPLDCHRTILVGREVERAGRPVTHILADGTLEANRQAIARLAARLKRPESDLFESESGLAEAAYEAQAARIAPKAPAARSRRPV
jgi:uncharacterized protein (DUF488 family)